MIWKTLNKTHFQKQEKTEIINHDYNNDNNISNDYDDNSNLYMTFWQWKRYFFLVISGNPFQDFKFPIFNCFLNL